MVVGYTIVIGKINVIQKYPEGIWYIQRVDWLTKKKLRAPPPRSSVGLPTGAAAELLPIQHGHMYLMAELIMYIYVHDCTCSYVLIMYYVH